RFMRLNSSRVVSSWVTYSMCLALNVESVDCVYGLVSGLPAELYVLSCTHDDLVKSHLMYAVREEVEVLKEQIKELYERNSVLERENAVLKSLANTQQLSQLSSQLSCLSPPLQLHQPPFITNSAHSLVHHEGSQGVSYQPNITSA
ncbi:hypothetical protein GOODEAATRI_003847, partial [Goodea atripinnis]